MSDIYRRFFLFPDILIMLVLLIGISSYTIAQPFHWSIFTVLLSWTDRL